jgi:hypothetical protein
VTSHAANIHGKFVCIQLFTFIYPFSSLSRNSSNQGMGFGLVQIAINTQSTRINFSSKLLQFVADSQSKHTFILIYSTLSDHNISSTIAGVII